MKRSIRMISIALAALLVAASASCSSAEGSGNNTGSGSGSQVSTDTGKYYDKDMSASDVIKDAASKGNVGNWGLGNEYAIQALLAKYGFPTTYLSQNFDMDGFDSDEILLASAMTYNELGLVVNSYEGGYGYGDTVKTINMNDEGVAMLEDNIFCTKKFASENPNTVKAFLCASLKGWQYACENPDEAAQIVYEAGSSVSADHQKYMASEVAKLVTTDTAGNHVTDYGAIVESAMQQTLDLAKQYIPLEDSAAKQRLADMTLSDVYDDSFVKEITEKGADAIGTPEKSSVKIQLKWLPQAQFMGYYVAAAKGYYKDVGLEVEIVPDGVQAGGVGVKDSGGDADRNCILQRRRAVHAPAVSSGLEGSRRICLRNPRSDKEP